MKRSHRLRTDKSLLAGAMASLLLAAPLAYGTPSIDPITDADYPPRNEAKENLGKLLMFDKILSGNQNISCATCHHPLAGTGDGLALSIGEGGAGLGVTRNNGSGASAVPERVPRNAPHIFNLGANDITVIFHDGRVAENPADPTGFTSPAGADLPAGLDSALAVQAMFPVTSGTEMAGQAGENPVGDAAAIDDRATIWNTLAARVAAIPEYVTLFQAAYPGEVNSAADINFVRIANAIAAFETAAWRADNSPFDRFLRGDVTAMSQSARRGWNLFNTKANCASCHSGKFFTDQEFHAIGVPQIGPGKGDGSDGHEDFGRERVTADSADRYKFRTPTLRNVAITGPWGHDGAYNTLEGMVRHHLDAVNSLNGYDKTQAVLISRPDLDALDFVVHDDTVRRQAIADAVEIAPVKLTDKQFQDLMDFLNALTDVPSLDLRKDVPQTVPSGLSVAE